MGLGFPVGGLVGSCVVMLGFGLMICCLIVGFVVFDAGFSCFWVVGCLGLWFGVWFGCWFWLLYDLVWIVVFSCVVGCLSVFVWIDDLECYGVCCLLLVLLSGVLCFGVNSVGSYCFFWYLILFLCL